MDLTQLSAALEKHLPPQAFPYCLQLWRDRPFGFKLTGPRKTKVGDFICHPGSPDRDGLAKITVNANLSPYLFLITYIHEVAHLHVHHQHGRKAESHGNEWKESFRQLMAPVMRPDIFPPALLEALSLHMTNPMASTFSDPGFTSVLREHDPGWRQAVLLSDLPEGSLFGLHGRWFRKGKLRRTRVLCMEMKTRRKYLVPADAPVVGAQLSLL